jgi:hypothetical protein
VVAEPISPEEERQAPLPLEAELRARPHDEALWLVAADRWLEQGFKWADRVAARKTGFPEEDAMLCAAAACLGLEVSWRMGFVQRASIRPACIRADLMPEFVLLALLRHPLARFLEQLEVDGLDLNDLATSRIEVPGGVLALLEQWLPPWLTNLEVGVAQLESSGGLEQLATRLAGGRLALRQRYWLHGTLRIDPGGEVSPVFGAELDCQGLVRCAFERLPVGTYALRVLDDVNARIGTLEMHRDTLWFPGETLEVQGKSLRFSEHTQTLLVVPAR